MILSVSADNITFWLRALIRTPSEDADATLIYIYAKVESIGNINKNNKIFIFLPQSVISLIMGLCLDDLLLSPILLPECYPTRCLASRVPAMRILRVFWFPASHHCS